MNDPRGLINSEKVKENNRVEVSIDDIMQSQIEDVSKDKIADLFPDYTDYAPKLYKALQLPSYVHGYSLAIEFMRDWFLSKFDNNEFKSIYINGSHILDNWKNWNNYNIRREKPMLAITPTLNYDWDRENLDLYMGDANMLLHTSRYDQSFFKDYDHMLFLYLRLREMEMNFNYRIRVNSRAQQLDMLNKMELKFRIGATHRESLSVDFHIPEDLTNQLAIDAGFEMDKENNIPKDIPEFLQYLNLHSSAPIIFKMRAINQKPAFFIRVRDLVTHISTRDKISYDDGEREGKLDTNFHLEFQVRLRMPVPHFYAYMAEIPIADGITISERKPAIGIYTINNYDIKPENNLGWPSIAVTSYYAEKGETAIDISSLFKSRDWPVAKVLFESLELGMSPQGFIDVHVYHNNTDIAAREADFHMDYMKMQIILDEDVKEDMMYDIAIYADMKYVNEYMINHENYENNRVKINT